MLELEKQLQMKELLRKQQESAEKVKEMKTKAETLATTAKTSPISEEEELAFRKRLEEAKKKAEMLSMKRNETETEIMR